MDTWISIKTWRRDAPWPATKDELLDYATRSGVPMEVIENLEEIEDEGDIYESIEEIWPDYPSKEDFLFDEEEYWFLNKSLKHKENSDIIIVNMLISLFIYLKIVRWKPWKGEMNYKRNFVAWV